MHPNQEEKCAFNKKTGFFVLISVSLGGVLLSLILVELILSVTNKPSNHIWGWRYHGKRTEEINQLGFRGQRISYDKQDYVVLLVGDSQVQSATCAFEYMPEKRLEYHISNITGKAIRVFSLGDGGYGQDQQLLALKEFFRDYSADLVVVWESPGNDVWNNMFPTHWPKDGTPKPTFWLDGNDKLKGPKVSQSKIRILSLIKRTLFKRSLDDLWEQRYLPAAYEPITNYSDDALEDWNGLNTKLENIENEKTHFGLSLVPISKRTKYGLRLTNKLLMAMNQVSNNNGARFMAFAVERPDFPPPDGVYKLNRGSRTIYPKLSRKQYWDNVREINDGIDFFRIPVLVKEFMSGSDAHLNEQAVDQVMRSLATELKRLIQR